MNSHLNVFKTYTRKNREHQLENDLTRSLAVCLQEDALFFHEVLKAIIDDESEFELIFSNDEVENKIEIDIQVSSDSVSGFEKIIAVSLSDYEMSKDHFWSQSHHAEYDPICDIVITVNRTIIIIEAKRDKSDCTRQLYNQAFNISRKHGEEKDMRSSVTPYDLNWKKIMRITSRVLAFEKTVDNVNRFTDDFLNLVKGHNPQWIPEAPIASLQPDNRYAIFRRIESAINALDVQNDFRKLVYGDRVGLVFEKPWAQELLFSISSNGNLNVVIYPGNTRAQGWHIFSKNLQISDNIVVDGIIYKVKKAYHVKFTSFQKYFTGISFYDDALKKPGFYSKKNFDLYTGRKYRDNGDWSRLESLFDEYFEKDFDWQTQVKWQDKVVKTTKTRFDISFGYELYINIPFTTLKENDTSANNLEGLKKLITGVYSAFESDLLKL
jgi:hypothetical protein